ncbi:MAG: hypothetical protein H6607_04890 [Flavobacteriales bacterium]|nr:hypothetical protein [Flavobacteriales bacterium]
MLKRVSVGFFLTVWVLSQTLHTLHHFSQVHETDCEETSAHYCSSHFEPTDCDYCLHFSKQPGLIASSSIEHLLPEDAICFNQIKNTVKSSFLDKKRGRAPPMM